jgi:hypothetical protein
MSEDVKAKQYFIVESENYNKPPYLDSHGAYHCKQAMYENIHVIELEPTLQLMDEMGAELEYVKLNALTFESSEIEQVLEKYRKFKESLK